MAQVKCESCGGLFDPKEPKCPYCGYIYIPGAEEKYLHNLDDIKEDLNEIPEIQKENFNKEVKKSVHTLVKAVVITVIVIAIFGGIFLSCNLIEDKMYHYDSKAEMLWEKENYPKLDEWYANGELDKIAEFREEMYASNEGDHTLYNWEHNALIEAYVKYKEVMKDKDILLSGEELTKFQREDIVYYCMWFHFKEYEKILGDGSEEDLAQMESYREQTDPILYENLKFTDDELDKLYENCTKKGYFSMDPCFKYVNKVYERFE